MNEVGVWTISGHLTLFYKQVVCLNEMNWSKLEDLTLILKGINSTGLCCYQGEDDEINIDSSFFLSTACSLFCGSSF